MQVVRTNIFTNKENVMEIPLTFAELANGYNLRDGGMLIQEAFPTLTRVQTEFLMSGMTVEEQNKFYGTELEKNK